MSVTFPLWSCPNLFRQMRVCLEQVVAFVNDNFVLIVWLHADKGFIRSQCVVLTLNVNLCFWITTIII